MAQTVPSVDEDKIVRYISEKGPVASAEVAEAFDLALQDAADALIRIEREQEIRSEKSDGVVYWMQEETSRDDVDGVSDTDNIELLSQESIEYITTGDTGELPESYRLQQLLEEIECEQLDTPVSEIAGTGDIELLHNLFDHGFEEDLSQGQLEDLTVNDVVEKILDLQQQVHSPVDALYRPSFTPTGDVLRAVRDQLGLSQREVADNTSVNQAQLSNYENTDKGVSDERLQDVVEFYRNRYEENESPFQSKLIS